MPGPAMRASRLDDSMNMSTSGDEPMRDANPISSRLLEIGRSGESRERLETLFALMVVYVVWGSTYLAIRVALRTYPPFLIGGLRYLIAGAILLLVLRVHGTPAPTRKQWQQAALIGVLLMAGGNAPIIYAEQTVGSALTALMIASMPLWLVLMSWLWGQSPTGREGMGLAVGFVGVILLSLQGDLRASPIGLGCLLMAN